MAQPPPVPSSPNLVALLHGPDRRGLVAQAAQWIFARGGNILHADQHRDAEAGVFFQRLEWEPAQPAAADEEAALFRLFAETALGMTVRVRQLARPLRVALWVSKQDHCLHDLCLRHRAGELENSSLVGVLSNHENLGPVAEAHGLPFCCVPVGPAKAEAEAAQLAQTRAWGTELVILARYMQILSDRLLAALQAPVINIHHSFLPAFAGARPYHQAHARGVKLIGATAHYATPVLDDGPIIHQEVARVSHRHGVEDLVRLGRDLEKSCLARAVRWHLAERVLVYANKTVVFD